MDSGPHDHEQADRVTSGEYALPDAAGQHVDDVVVDLGDAAGRVLQQGQTAALEGHPVEVGVGVGDGPVDPTHLDEVGQGVVGGRHRSQGRREPGDELVGRRRDELVLAREAAVDRHRGGADLAGQAPDGQGLGTLGGEDPGGRFEQGLPPVGLDLGHGWILGCL